MRCTISLLISIMLLLVTGCSRQPPVHTATSTWSVAVSIPPQKYFVEKICGDYATVKVLIPAGASPHTFEPKPSQMTGLSDAQLYFAIGVEMEAVWLPRLKSVCPNLRIIATDSGIVRLEETCKHEEGEGHGGHDDHTGGDPHIWLAPLLVKQQARSIAAAFCTLDTMHRNEYLKRLAIFERELDTLSMVIKANVDKCGESRTFLVFHPSWGYFAREFSLTQLSIESEGKEPGMREIGLIAGQARQHGISTILVQPQFSKKVAETIARELGGKTAVADPLAENWSENLLTISRLICNDQ